MGTHLRQGLEVSCRLGHLLTVEHQVAVAAEGARPVLLGENGGVVVQCEGEMILQEEEGDVIISPSLAALSIVSHMFNEHD